MGLLRDIDESDIHIGVRCDGWEDAIERSAQPLVDAGKIEPRYIESMIDAVKRSGPYIVLCPGVALAHSRPDCGVRELALGFTTLDPGVTFGNEAMDPIRLIITLAAVDDESHLDLMGELAGVLMEPEHIESLIEAPDAASFLSLLKDYAVE